MPNRVLLGIDFVGSNYANARRSIREWWEYVSREDAYDCKVGVSSFCSRREALPGGDGTTPADVLKDLEKVVPREQLLQWTSETDGQILEVVRRGGFMSLPLYSPFNYGSVNNRLLILAYSYGCDYVVRIDPGTRPPASVSFRVLMREHEEAIGGDTSVVVSRMYAGRLALRDSFVRNGSERRHADLVQAYTGIDVFAQITGGAMLTQKTPGTPAMCFPSGDGLTLVWGSDDGIYQQLPQTRERSMALRGFPVERFDAVGKTKTSSEYYRGILGAVFLKAIREGKPRMQAEQAVDGFLQELNEEIIDVEKCIQSDTEQNWVKGFTRMAVAPPRYLDAIAQGCRNHEKLLQEWAGVCEAVKDRVVETIGRQGEKRVSE